MPESTMHVTTCYCNKHIIYIMIQLVTGTEIVGHPHAYVHDD